MFQDRTIEMNDFTIELQHMPPDRYFRGKEGVLRAKIWEQLEAVMTD